jgi:hypothetical protein
MLGPIMEKKKLAGIWSRRAFRCRVRSHGRFGHCEARHPSIARLTFWFYLASHALVLIGKLHE